MSIAGSRLQTVSISTRHRHSFVAASVRVDHGTETTSKAPGKVADMTGGEDQVPLTSRSDTSKGASERNSQRRTPGKGRLSPATQRDLDEGLYTLEQRKEWMDIMIGALRSMGVKGGSTSRPYGADAEQLFVGKDGETIEQVRPEALHSVLHSVLHPVLHSPHTRVTLSVTPSVTLASHPCYTRLTPVLHSPHTR
eukprot:6444386-Pyramimonas_sp.AAC.2